MNRRHFTLWMAGLAAVTAAAAPPATDDTIYNQVKLKLASDADVKGGALDIDVAKGVVTVKGIVASEKAKAKAERIVKKVKGVTGVRNQLEVRSGGLRP